MDSAESDVEMQSLSVSSRQKSDSIFLERDTIYDEKMVIHMDEEVNKLSKTKNKDISTLKIFENSSLDDKLVLLIFLSSFTSSIVAIITLVLIDLNDTSHEFKIVITMSVLFIMMSSVVFSVNWIERVSRLGTLDLGNHKMQTMFLFSISIIIATTIFDRVIDGRINRVHMLLKCSFAILCLLTTIELESSMRIYRKLFLDYSVVKTEIKLNSSPKRSIRKTHVASKVLKWFRIGRLQMENDSDDSEFIVSGTHVGLEDNRRRKKAVVQEVLHQSCRFFRLSSYLRMSFVSGIISLVAYLLLIKFYLSLRPSTKYHTLVIDLTLFYGLTQVFSVWQVTSFNYLISKFENDFSIKTDFSISLFGWRPTMGI